MSNQSHDEDYVEVWADLIRIKDLVLSLVISSVTTLGGYIIAPGESPKPLLFGLVGAIVGFIVSSVLIRPKRTFKYIDEEEKP